jgi:hypothetical protein
MVAIHLVDLRVAPFEQVIKTTATPLPSLGDSPSFRQHLPHPFPPAVSLVPDQPTALAFVFPTPQPNRVTGSWFAARKLGDRFAILLPDRAPKQGDRFIILDRFAGPGKVTVELSGMKATHSATDRCKEELP